MLFALWLVLLIEEKWINEEKVKKWRKIVNRWRKDKTINEEKSKQIKKKLPNKEKLLIKREFFWKTIPILIGKTFLYVCLRFE